MVTVTLPKWLAYLLVVWLAWQAAASYPDVKSGFLALERDVTARSATEGDAP